MWRLLLLGVAVSLCFPAGAARGHVPLSPSWSSNYFSSPSGNIRCREFVKKDLMACLTLNDNFAAIVPLYGNSRKQRSVGAWQFPHGPTLDYGESWRDPGRFRCKSRSDGMRCWSIPTGHGFFISRDTYDLW
ncbi:MAG: hypothetical protein IT201_14810 [Thermoleophilia bacterium]|nr:hypothetical protein [Thermoleophilia bacterium]